MKLRNSIKAVIIKNNSILLQKNEDNLGLFYLLPGGGMNAGETMHDALRRECKEEISCDVTIGQLRLIREYIGKNHEFAELDSDVHQIEFMFECSIPDDAQPCAGHVPDDCQIAIEWIPLDELSNIPLYPQCLKTELLDFDTNATRYLGDVN